MWKPAIGPADFARLAFVLLLAPLAIEENCLASNRIQGTSHKNLNKNAAHIPRLHWNNCKKRQIDRVKNDFDPPSHALNWTSRQSNFLAVILSRHVFKNMTVKWLKKQNCLLCQNLESSKAALRLLWRLAKFWQSGKIWQVFETGGRTYFTLLVDRFLTYTNKIDISATRGFKSASIFTSQVKGISFLWTTWKITLSVWHSKITE